MDRHIPALAVVLALQILFVVGVTWWRTAEGTSDTKPLLAFESAEIDRITIDDGEGQSVTLEKDTSGWTLPALDGLPVDAQKVSDMLGKLGSKDPSWPVATTDAAAKRFEVTEEKFQRRIRLANGEEVLVDLFLGTSPGFRKVHARRGDDSAVHAITFANYEASTKAQDWLSKSVIAPEGEITAIEIPGRWRISRDGDTWQLESIGEGQTTAEDKARELASKLENLRVVDVADEGSVNAVLDAAPLFELSANTGSTNVTYTFWRPAPDGDYLVRSSTRPQTFRVAALNVEGLDVARESLIAVTAPDPAGASAAPAPAATDPAATDAAPG